MNLPDLTWIGIWLLVIAVVLILLEGALVATWSVRLGRRARVLSLRLASEQSYVRAEVQRLRASLAEMQELWQPYRRLLRWLRHPLTIALMQSLVRRAAR